MDKKEAIEILGLKIEFDKDELKKIYTRQFISAFRAKSAALTIIESEQLDRRLHEFNEAFCTLDDSEILERGDYQFDFRHLQAPTKYETFVSKGNNVLEESLQSLLSEGHHLLLLRLLEISIFNYLSDKSKKMTENFFSEVRMMGKTLIELGLINQGVVYYAYGLNFYEKAKRYFSVGDYRSAIHFFGKELKNGKSQIPKDEICQQISISYFLLNEYRNAVGIIEDVLPELLPNKEIFEHACRWKNFATELMVSIYKVSRLESKTLDNLKIRMKYPLSAKYLQKCYGKVSEAFKIIDKFEKNHAEYDDFLDSIKPKSIVREKISSDYSFEDLKEKYFSFFDDSISKSLIYNPK